MKTMALALLFALMLTGAGYANQIHSVIAVDYLTVEVMMDEPLTEAELARPAPAGGKDPVFLFNEGVYMTGAPIPQRFDGFHDNVYRIPVSGMDIGPIYQISYASQKPRTFKVYEGREMTERYRNRYGSYF